MVAGFVNREREIRELRKRAAAPPALVVLRGRRRVGKTALLRVAFRGPRVVHVQAEEQPRALQLETLARELGRLLPGAPVVALGSWGDAFGFVEREARERGPLVLILDEVQYLVASDPGLLSKIQRAWDGWDADGVPVTLVLSGSALTFMEGVLSAHGPVYGRSDYRPFLKPLTYRESAAFARKGMRPDRLIERYAVLGGTPQYQRWAGTRPLTAVITEAILSPDGPLHNDPEHLIRAEDGIREPGPYFGVLQAIAEGRTTTGQVAGRLEMKQPLASQFLSRLEDLGYVRRMDPLTPGVTRAPRGYWKISDPYLRFWFRYVLPNRGRLARGRIAEVAKAIADDFTSFVGPTFEDCCRDWVGRYSRLGEGALEVGSWWSRNNATEIDIVCHDKKSYTLLGSCKWSTRAVSVDVLDSLLEARAVLGPKAARARLALFARVGFAEGVRKRAKRERVTLVEAADLFR